VHAAYPAPISSSATGAAGGYRSSEAYRSETYRASAAAEREREYARERGFANPTRPIR
jgi:hypothetical protein